MERESSEAIGARQDTEIVGFLGGMRCQDLQGGIL